MKRISSLAAAALLAMVVASAHARVPTVERVCEPNSSWKRDCNDCICTEDLTAMCTKRDCSATTVRPPSRCRPGETWRQGCNTCSCLGGAAVCTQMACLDDGWQGPHHPSSPTAEPEPPQLLPGRPGMGARCRPGQVWMEDCNSCRCAGGRPICTMMACIGTSTTSSPIRPIPVGNECTPGATWKESCNDCRCTPNGLAVCTMKRCLGKRDVEVVINTDSSSSSSSSSEETGQGQGHAIRKRSVDDSSSSSSSSSSEETGHGQGHAIGKRNVDDSSSSSSSSSSEETGHVIGKRSADDSSSSSSEEHDGQGHGHGHSHGHGICQPGSSWKHDCNTCRCGSSGMPSCTKMRCVKPFDSVDGEPQGQPAPDQPAAAAPAAP